MSEPIVLGAGPAGCAAAIGLARAGYTPRLLDRSATVGDALCGGFMSWRTAGRAEGLGVDLSDIGAHQVRRLRLFAGGRFAEAALPRPAWGLSRRAFDSALRKAALREGALFEERAVKSMSGRTLVTDTGTIEAETLFLAVGKSDVRGAGRPRTSGNPALGLRVRACASPQLSALVADSIELHLFDGGYAGIVLQEDGSANICLALRKSMLAEHRRPRALLDACADRHPAFAERLAFVADDAAIDSVAAVPYGYIASHTTAGVFRLGDQAAVIPSLAGEGMGIALASGVMATEMYARHGTNGAEAYQSRFAKAARRPVRTAQALWHTGENPVGAYAMETLTRLFPAAADLAMRMTRIAA